MDSTAPVLTSIQAISTFLLGYAGTLAALGALTVALMEAYKKLFDVQARFQRLAMLRWFLNDQSGSGSHYFAQSATTPASARNEGYDAGRAYEQLLDLTTGVGAQDSRLSRRFEVSRALSSRRKFSRSIEYALFELETDRLMGQVQDAADLAVNNPSLYPDLFAFLTRGALADDVANWKEDVKSVVSSLNASDQQRKEVADRFTRLKQIVRRQLDSYQIVTAMRWREWNQFAAVIVGAVLLFIAQVFALGQGANGTWSSEVFQRLFTDHPLLWAKLILISVFGGMLAPVAKDLVDALRKVKSGV